MVILRWDDEADEALAKAQGFDALYAIAENGVPYLLGFIVDMGDGSWYWRAEGARGYTDDEWAAKWEVTTASVMEAGRLGRIGNGR